MKSRTSFYNKGLIYANLKRFWWVSALHALILFLVLPMQLMMENTRRFAQLNAVNLFYRDYGMVSSLMLCVVPILIATLIFRYMQITRSTTMLHGMPFSRNMLFGNSVISGIILFTIPLVVNSLILASIKYTMPIGEYFTLMQLCTWLFNSLILSLVLFSLAVFVGMFTGNVASHFVFTYIVHFLPLFFYVLVGGLFHILVYGFRFDEPPKWLMKFPMMAITENFFQYTWIYLIASAILLGVALFVYKKRPLENATDIVIFNFIKPIFKYGVTFCFTIAGYMYTSDLTNSTPNIITALIWAFIGYVIAEMLLQKTFRIWKSYKGYLVFAVLIFAVWGGIKFDVTGYEKRLPNINNVASVVIDRGYSYKMNGSLKNSENIANVYDIHKKAISNIPVLSKRSVYNRDSESMQISIDYKMKNGSHLKRSYYIDKNSINDELTEIYNTEEYKYGIYPILSQNIDEIKFLEITNKERTVIGERQKIIEVVSALRQDILNSQYSDVEVQKESKFVPTYIYVHTVDENEFKYDREAPNQSRSYYIFPTYENTKKWFEQNK